MDSTLDMLQITLNCQWGSTGQAAQSEMKVGRAPKCFVNSFSILYS